MALEITGKLVNILPEQTGNGKNGTWVKQEFVIETQEQYPKKVCCSAWGDKVEVLKKLRTGDQVKVSFNLESREYNNRWYTDVRAWKIEANVSSGSGSGSAPAPTNEPFISSDSLSGEEPDDLPF